MQADRWIAPASNLDGGGGGACTEAAASAPPTRPCRCGGECVSESTPTPGSNNGRGYPAGHIQSRWVCGGGCGAARTGCPPGCPLCHELFSCGAVKVHAGKCERLQAEAAAKKAGTAKKKARKEEVVGWPPCGKTKKKHRKALGRPPCWHPAFWQRRRGE
jgi:hypothetical protein